MKRCAPVAALDLRKGTIGLSLSTTVAILGTPQDVTLQELRVECFFPPDGPTADLFRAWPAASRTVRR